MDTEQSPIGCTRRGLLVGGTGAALSLAAGAWPVKSLSQQAGRNAKPNILVLLADDLACNTIHMLGNAVVRTPNLDQLAARGTSMACCYNQGAWHGSVCMSSRAMIQTGRHLFRVVDPHDARKAGNLDTPHTLWAEYFKANGYDTFGTGKWYGSDDSIRRCFHTAPGMFMGGMHAYNDEGKIARVPIQTGHGLSSVRHFDGKDFHDETIAGWSTDLFADHAITYLTTRKGQTHPFFAFVAFTAPHDPRHAPEAYMDLYDPEKIELPANFMDEHPFNFGQREIRDEVLLDYPRDKRAVRREIAAYYAMITHLDDRIGDILKALKAAGQADNTLIVFTSDHGLSLGQHGLLGKQNLYEHAVRVPMVWSGPGINPGEISEELVYLHSLFATSCELAGLEVPKAVDAPSLVPVLAGVEPGERTIYGAYADAIRMVRDDRYKLIEYPKLDKTQLFDLQEDAWEMTDLSQQMPMRVKGMGELLRGLQTSVGDTLRLD